MDAEYLKANVGEVLAQGMTAVVLNQPEDSVDFLGRWLIKYVQNAEEEEARLAAEKAEAEADAKLLADIKAAEEAAAKAKADQDAAYAAKSKELEEFLASADSFDGFQDGFLEKLAGLVNTDSVYIGAKETIEGVEAADAGGEEEGGPGPATAQLKYIASHPSQSFLLGKSLLNNQGVTFDIFKEKAAAEEGGEEGEDGGETAAAPAVEDEQPSVYVPNVLMGEGSKNLHFWKLPNLGAYFTIQVKYDACLADSALDYADENEEKLVEQRAAEEAEARAKAEAEAAEAAAAAAAEAGEAAEAEEGEAEGEDKKDETPAEPTESEEDKLIREEKEAKESALANDLYFIAKVPKVTTELALCADTLGQGRRFTEDEMATIKKFAALFLENTVRIDRATFTAERLARKAQKEKDASREEVSEADIADEKANIAGALEKQGLPFTEADVNFKYCQNTLSKLREQIAEFKTYNVFKGHIEVILALFYLCDIKKEDLLGHDGKTEWKKIRVKFNEDLFNTMSTFDAREQQIRPKSQNYATVKSLKKMISAFSLEEVTARNKRVGSLYEYVAAAIAVKEQAKSERVEAKRKAEEEARLAAEAAAAEAEAAAAAENGEEAPAE